MLLDNSMRLENIRAILLFSSGIDVSWVYFKEQER